VDWYHTWHGSEKDIHNYTVDQIKHYCDLGQVRQVPWVQS
jgi:hypothetical protein